VRVQVTIDGVGRVDLLVDGWLIIELDGGHHADPIAMRRDRARDAAAILRGYRTLRFGYDAVMYDWPTVLRTIGAVLADGAPRAAGR
jgi:very-short-patch-repair endonuclease